MNNNNNNGCVGAPSIIIGITFIVISFIINKTRNDYKPAQIISYTRGQTTGQTYAIGGNIESYEKLTLLFWGILILGIFLIILGICLSGSKSKEQIDNPKQPPSHLIVCPNCGEANGKNNDYCFSCKSPLKIEEDKQDNNSWKCKKCGKTNQNYVGTCGCGEVKPR